jgi:hypothetical protein
VIDLTAGPPLGEATHWTAAAMGLSQRGPLSCGDLWASLGAIPYPPHEIRCGRF